MNDWEWESFHTLIDYRTKIANPGPLHSPINSISIKRDDKLQLVVETVAAQDAKSKAPMLPIGTVRVNTDEVALNCYGAKVVATGVQPLGFTTTTSQDPRLEVSRERALIHSLEGSIDIAGEAAYTIEWLVNVDDHLIWPDHTNDETDTVKVRTICKAQNGPVLRYSHKAFGGSRNCVRLKVGNIDLYFGVSSTDLVDKKFKPGFILYMSVLPDETRQKIKDCLSFSLGMYLVSLGYSTFNQDWDLTSFKAISSYTIDNKVFDKPPLPPIPLSLRCTNEIDSGILSRAVNALYCKYDGLEFNRLSWMYLHAVCAPVHTAAVQFGATIEALQKIFFRDHAKPKLLKEVEWDAINSTVESLLALIVGRHGNLPV